MVVSLSNEPQIDAFERKLIAKAIITGSVEKVVDSGIELDHFVSAQVREVWADVLKHWQTYRTPPSLEAFQAMHPMWDLPVVSDPLDYLIDRMRSDVKRRIVQDGMREVAVFLRENPDQWANADKVLFDKARQIFRDVPDRKALHFREMESRIDLYEARKGAGYTSPGILMGIPSIDAETGGIQPHEMVTVIGFSGVGKSMLMQYIGHQAVEQDRVVLLLTLEMGSDPVFRRLDALETHIPVKAIKDFDLSDGEVDEWRAGAERAKSRKGDIIVFDNLGEISVGEVWRWAERYQPDLIVIDYINLMRSTLPNSAASWEKIAQVTRELKRMTNSLQIPVLAAAQTNAEGATKGGDVTTVGYSRTIVQDSDICLGIHRTEEMKANRQMEVRLSKNRDGKNVVVQMLWDLDTMTIREWDAGDDIAAAFGGTKAVITEEAG